MNRRIGLFALCMIGLTLGACAAEAPVEDSEEEAASQEIADRVSGYLDVIQRGDVEAAADYWTEDARLIGPGIELDRTSVLEGMSSVFETGTRVEVVRRPTLELFAHEDVAYEIAQAEEVFLSGTGAPPDTARNHMFIRWERGPDGLWRFDRVLLTPRDAAS